MMEKRSFAFFAEKEALLSLQLHLTVLSAAALTYMHVGPFLAFSHSLEKITEKQRLPSLTAYCHIKA